MFWKKLQLGFIVLWPRTDCKLKSSNSDNSISFSAKNKVLFFGCSTQEWNEVITNKKKLIKTQELCSELQLSNSYPWVRILGARFQIPTLNWPKWGLDLKFFTFFKKLLIIFVDLGETILIIVGGNSFLLKNFFGQLKSRQVFCLCLESLCAFLHKVLQWS